MLPRAAALLFAALEDLLLRAQSTAQRKSRCPKPKAERSICRIPLSRTVLLRVSNAALETDSGLQIARHCATFRCLSNVKDDYLKSLSSRNLWISLA